MDFLKFCKGVVSGLCAIETNLQTEQRFSQRELNEILQNAKSENLCFLKNLSKINKLSAFDVSFLLSSVKLDLGKIEIIEEAVKLYNDKEFSAQGQTFSDFIFKVAANINMLDGSNLELFKDLAKCKNDIYDFSKILRNPTKYIHKHKKEMSFAFEKVFY